MSRLITLIALSFSLITVPAKAALIFSDLVLTDNSLTFTVNGDMSGYDLTNTYNGVTDISIIYSGDVWNSSVSGVSSNNWTNTMFDGVAFVAGGTGLWDSNTLYSWIELDSRVSNDMTASNNRVTLSFTNSYFNTAATSGQIDFIAGWGNSNSSLRSELLGSFVIGQVQQPPQVPEPSGLALFATALLALRLLTRKAA